MCHMQGATSSLADTLTLYRYILPPTSNSHVRRIDAVKRTSNSNKTILVR